MLLDNVVEIRRPDLLPDVTRHTGLGASQVDDQLGFWAQVLRDVARDFLRAALPRSTRPVPLSGVALPRTLSRSRSGFPMTRLLARRPSRRERSGRPSRPMSE